MSNHLGAANGTAPAAGIVASSSKSPHGPAPEIHGTCNAANPSLIKAFDKKAKGYLNALHRSFSTSAMEKNDMMLSEDADPSTMTIEFLRARLQSQRAAFRAERQRARVLAQKVLELEKKLKMEMRLRRKADGGSSGEFTDLNISPTRSESGQDESTPAKHGESPSKLVKLGSYEIEELDDELLLDCGKMKSIQFVTARPQPVPPSMNHSLGQSYMTQDCNGETSSILPWTGQLVGERSKRFGAKYRNKLLSLTTNGQHHVVNAQGDQTIHQEMPKPSNEDKPRRIKERMVPSTQLCMPLPDGTNIRGASSRPSLESGGDLVDIRIDKKEDSGALDTIVGEKHGSIQPEARAYNQQSNVIPKDFATKALVSLQRPALVDVQSSGIRESLATIASTLLNEEDALKPRRSIERRGSEVKHGETINDGNVGHRAPGKTLEKGGLAMPEELSSSSSSSSLHTAEACDRSKAPLPRCSKSEMLKLLELIRQQLEITNEPIV